MASSKLIWIRHKFIYYKQDNVKYVGYYMAVRISEVFFNTKR